MTLEELRAGFIALTKSPTPEYKAVMQRWEGFQHTIRINGKWRLQGFITWLMYNHELLRCVDPSVPPFPALHLFNPKVIAHLLSIPPQEAGCRSGRIGMPGRPKTTSDLAEFANDRFPNMTWKEIADEWKRLNQQDNRKITADKMKEAYRRAYRSLRNPRRY